MRPVITQPYVSPAVAFGAEDGRESGGRLCHRNPRGRSGALPGACRSLFPRLAELERNYGSVVKGMSSEARQRRREATANKIPPKQTGRMWSLKSGLRVLVESLAQALEPAPLRGVSVRSIEPPHEQERAWTITAEEGSSWQADAVVLTCPAAEQAQLLRSVDAILAGLIARIEYAPVAVVALGFRREHVPVSLNGFGYLTPQRLRRDLLGVQWCSSIFPDRARSDMVLLRALCGGWNRREMIEWDDDSLLASVLAELRCSMGIVAPPEFQQIIRWERAIPQYHMGHLERTAWIEARSREHPGVFLGGNAFGGVALNDCTQNGPRFLPAR